MVLYSQSAKQCVWIKKISLILLQVKGSSEMVFFYSIGGMEEYNLRFFLMVTHSPGVHFHLQL